MAAPCTACVQGNPAGGNSEHFLKAPADDLSTVALSSTHVLLLGLVAGAGVDGGAGAGDGAGVGGGAVELEEVQGYCLHWRANRVTETSLGSVAQL